MSAARVPAPASAGAGAPAPVATGQAPAGGPEREHQDAEPDGMAEWYAEVVPADPTINAPEQTRRERSAWEHDRYDAAHTVPRLGWSDQIAEVATWALAGRLTVDAAGVVRLDGGRRVARARVDLLRSGAFVRLPADGQPGPIVMTKDGARAARLAEVYPEGLHADDRAGYTARRVAAKKPGVSSDTAKEQARQLPFLPGGEAERAMHRRWVREVEQGAEEMKERRAQWAERQRRWDEEERQEQEAKERREAERRAVREQQAEAAQQEREEERRAERDRQERREREAWQGWEPHPPRSTDQQDDQDDEGHDMSKGVRRITVKRITSGLWHAISRGTVYVVVEESGEWPWVIVAPDGERIGNPSIINDEPVAESVRDIVRAHLNSECTPPVATEEPTRSNHDQEQPETCEKCGRERHPGASLYAGPCTPQNCAYCSRINKGQRPGAGRENRTPVCTKDGRACNHATPCDPGMPTEPPRHENAPAHLGTVRRVMWAYIVSGEVTRIVERHRTGCRMPHAKDNTLTDWITSTTITAGEVTTQTYDEYRDAARELVHADRRWLEAVALLRADGEVTQWTDGTVRLPAPVPEVDPTAEEQPEAEAAPVAGENYTARPAARPAPVDLRESAWGVECDRHGPVSVWVDIHGAPTPQHRAGLYETRADAAHAASMHMDEHRRIAADVMTPDEIDRAAALAWSADQAATLGWAREGKLMERTDGFWAEDISPDRDDVHKKVSASRVTGLWAAGLLTAELLAPGVRRIELTDSARAQLTLWTRARRIKAVEPAPTDNRLGIAAGKGRYPLMRDGRYFVGEEAPTQTRQEAEAEFRAELARQARERDTAPDVAQSLAKAAADTGRWTVSIYVNLGECRVYADTNKSGEKWRAEWCHIPNQGGWIYQTGRYETPADGPTTGATLEEVTAFATRPHPDTAEQPAEGAITEAPAQQEHAAADPDADHTPAPTADARAYRTTVLTYTATGECPQCDAETGPLYDGPGLDGVCPACVGRAFPPPAWEGDCHPDAADIVITHTRAQGTLMEGSTKGDGIFDAIRQFGWKPFRSLGCLGIQHSRDNAADDWTLERTAPAIRALGFTVALVVNEDERRSFAQAEADRASRAADRAERFGDYAGNAAARSQGAWKASHAIADHMTGEPVKVGHHSAGRHRRDIERMDSHMRRSIAEEGKSRYWADRAAAADNYEAYRKNPARTLRRIDNLNAELRGVIRWQSGGSNNGFEKTLTPKTVKNLSIRNEEIREELGYWAALIKDAEARGFKVWGQADFTKGEFALCGGTWYEVHRANKKTVTVTHIHGSIGRPVLRLTDQRCQDGTMLPYQGGKTITCKGGQRCKCDTGTIPYDSLSGRATAEEIASLEAATAEPEAERTRCPHCRKDQQSRAKGWCMSCGHAQPRSKTALADIDAAARAAAAAEDQQQEQEESPDECTGDSDQRQAEAAPHERPTENGQTVNPPEPAEATPPRMGAGCCSCGASVQHPVDGPRPACTHEGETRGAGVVVGGYTCTPAGSGRCDNDRHNITGVHLWRARNTVPQCAECVASNLGVDVAALPAHPEVCPMCASGKWDAEARVCAHCHHNPAGAPVAKTEPGEPEWLDGPAAVFIASENTAPARMRVLWRVTRAEAQALCSDDRTRGERSALHWTERPGTEGEDWEFVTDDGRYAPLLAELGISPARDWPEGVAEAFPASCPRCFDRSHVPGTKCAACPTFNTKPEAEAVPAGPSPAEIAQLAEHFDRCAQFEELGPWPPAAVAQSRETFNAHFSRIAVVCGLTAAELTAQVAAYFEAAAPRRLAIEGAPVRAALPSPQYAKGQHVIHTPRPITTADGVTVCGLESRGTFDRYTTYGRAYMLPHGGYTPVLVEARGLTADTAPSNHVTRVVELAGEGGVSRTGYFPQVTSRAAAVCSCGWTVTIPGGNWPAALAAVRQHADRAAREATATDQRRVIAPPYVAPPRVFAMEPAAQLPEAKQEPAPRPASRPAPVKVRPARRRPQCAPFVEAAPLPLPPLNEPEPATQAAPVTASAAAGDELMASFGELCAELDSLSAAWDAVGV